MPRRFSQESNETRTNVRVPGEAGIPAAPLPMRQMNDDGVNGSRRVTTDDSGSLRPRTAALREAVAPDLSEALQPMRALVAKLRRENASLAARIQEGEQRVGETRETLWRLEEEVANRSRREAALDRVLRVRTAEVEALRAQVASHIASHDALVRQLDGEREEYDRRAEALAHVHAELEEARHQSIQLRAESDALRMRLDNALNRWGGVRPSRVRSVAQFLSWIRRGRFGLIQAYFSSRQRSPLDRAAYYAANPDVAAARLNPLMHYLEHGAHERREHAPVLAWDDSENTPRGDPEGVPAADHDPHDIAHPRLVAASSDDAEAIVVAANGDPPTSLDPFFTADAGAAVPTPDRDLPAPGRAFENEDPLTWDYGSVVGDLGAVFDEFATLLAEFDADYYRARYGVAGGAAALLVDYMTTGWQLGRDPNSWFSTSYYLDMNADIREAGVNPFLHYVRYGRTEERLPQPYVTLKRRTARRPTVSAVVPCFNHARFLEQRLASILTQTVLPDEIVLLDDASSDESAEILREAALGSPVPVRLYLNKTNSGNVFRQWRKGISRARGDLVWICESDDFADARFLETLVPYFADPSVMLAFGRIEFADSEGMANDWLDHYRAEAAPREFWETSRVRSSYEWFRGPFGLINAIPNVGGSLVRRQTLPPTVWREAQRYSTCGDWYLYMQWAQSGRIAYDPDACSFFRQHGQNTSVASFSDPAYYEEHARIARELRVMYGVDDPTLDRFHARVSDHFFRHFDSDDRPVLDRVFPLSKIKSLQRQKRHIALGILGFTTGGAELFPINLANALIDRGYHVSLLVLNPSEENDGVRARVRPEVAIYERPLVEEIGVDAFLQRYGIDVVHTHFLGADLWLHEACRDAAVSYLVTLHGSYEAGRVEASTLASIAASVDHWVYTADKNLNPFVSIKHPGTPFTKLPNAVPVKDHASSLSRSDLGIPQEAFLFGLASRALKDKGWDIASVAVSRLREMTGRDVHLALCGDGPDYDSLFRDYGNYSGVHFLGYHSEIIDFYRLCDCCVLPTRFPGESFPFTLIESLQAGTPIVATRIGEIESMIGAGPDEAGIVDPVEDDELFADRFAAAMERMLGRERTLYARGATRAASRFSFDTVVNSYEEIYHTLIRRR
jgi:glycosyltransferase involved in cell wall biosynthesis